MSQSQGKSSIRMLGMNDTNVDISDDASVHLIIQLCRSLEVALAEKQKEIE